MGLRFAQAWWRWLNVVCHGIETGTVVACNSLSLYSRLTPREFNSYGSRRGNDSVMARGTFKPHKPQQACYMCACVHVQTCISASNRCLWLLTGTFANIRLVNKFMDKAGPKTKHFPSCERQQYSATVYSPPLSFIPPTPPPPPPPPLSFLPPLSYISPSLLPSLSLSLSLPPPLSSPPPLSLFLPPLSFHLYM